MSTPGLAARRPANPWLRFGARRLGRLLASLLVLVTASFAMIHLIPGDPVRATLGLDDPLLTQYLRYLEGLLTGDLGTSLSSQLPVSGIVAQRLPATLQLA